MKILLWPFIYFPSIGGVEMMTRSLAAELVKMGHQVIIFTDNVSQLSERTVQNTLSTRRANESGVFQAQVDEITVYYFPFKAALDSKRPHLIKETIDQITKILDQFNPDIANIHGMYEFYVFFQLRVLKKIPFFLTIHGPLEWSYCNSPSCLRLWSMAKGINTVSHALFNSLIQKNWHHPSFRVIHNGISLSRFPEPSLEIETHRIAMIGRFTSEKCFDIGFQAFKKVKQTFPKATLCLAGDGIDRDSLTRLRTELQLENAIEMPGFIDPHQIYQIIDRATIVWIPSLYESFCLVALETAIRQRAVIASNVLGLKETVENGKSGFLIKSQKPDILAKTTIALLKKPNLRKQMGVYARKRVAQLFSIESCASSYLKMYQTV